jgi:prefoldin subunit 5
MDATNTKLQDLETQVDFWKSEAENLQGTIVSINQQNQQNQQLIEEVLNNEI